jgi:uncharacterized secreted repeat protein (TIGR03808 family)
VALNRRRFLVFSAAGAAAATSPFMSQRATAAPRSSFGLDANHAGVRAGSPDDQSRALQAAIDQAAAARAPLALGPGVYRVGDLNLPTGAQLVGVRGATRLVLTRGPSLISASHTDAVTLSGLTLDGIAMPLRDGRGLVHLAHARGVRISDCEIVASGRHGAMLEACEGEVTGSTITGAEGAGIFSLDARGLRLSGNTVRGAGNNGILVWRSQPGDDGTLVVDNRIEDIAARAGGSGQNGNAINVFRAGNVMVRGNRIKGAAFSAVRGNAASNLQILGNTCTELGEVALYAEFGFEGALIANNVVGGAALGVAVTNFNEGGRLAVVQGNVIRNLVAFRAPGADPNDPAGIGIGVEADTAVTGNVIENAPGAGILLGWGRYMRDVAATGNVVRSCSVGIAVSVAAGAGSAVIADNLISGARRGAILGMDGHAAVTGDLAGDAQRFAHLTISGNRVR